MRLIVLLPMFCLSVAGCVRHPNYSRQWARYTAPDSSFAFDIPQGYKIYKGESNILNFGTFPETAISWKYPSSWLADYDIKLIELSFYDLPINWDSTRYTAILQAIVNDFMPGPFAKEDTATNEDFICNGFHGKKLKFIDHKSLYHSWQSSWKFVAGHRLYSISCYMYNRYSDTIEINRAVNSLVLNTNRGSVAFQSPPATGKYLPIFSNPQ